MMMMSRVIKVMKRMMMLSVGTRQVVEILAFQSSFEGMLEYNEVCREMVK